MASWSNVWKQEDDVSSGPSQRDLDIIQCRKDGMTYEAIGELYDLSGSRVATIVKRHDRRERVLDAIKGTHREQLTFYAANVMSRELGLGESWTVDEYLENRAALSSHRPFLGTRVIAELDAYVAYLTEQSLALDGEPEVAVGTSPKM